MVGRIIDWTDFTGGHFVGENSAHQPADTWRGRNCRADPNTGMLMPVPAWTAVTFNSGSPSAVDTGGACWMFHAAGVLYRVYDTSTANTGNIAKFASTTEPPTGPVNVTNRSIADCAGILAAVAWSSQYIYVSYYPSTGSNNWVKYTTASAAAAVSSIVDTMRLLARWGEFMVGVGAVSYRLHFSDAYDPDTWSGTYYDVGGPSPIGALVPFGDSLLIGKPDGWWILTGVPGDSVTIRQLTNSVPGPNGNATDVSTYGYPIQNNAIGSPYGVLFTAPSCDALLMLLNGNQARPLNYTHPPGQNFANVIAQPTPGLYTIGRGYNPVNDDADEMALWLMDSRLGGARWYLIGVPYASGALQHHIAEQIAGTPARAARDILWVDVDDDLYIIPGLDNTVGTGIVQLAERRFDQPVIIREIFVEYGWSPGASGPTVAATVEMRGHPDLTFPGRVESTSQTTTAEVTSSRPTPALYHDDTRQYAVARFPVDGPAGTGVIPHLTFTNCVIRRVWATYEPSGSF